VTAAQHENLLIHLRKIERLLEENNRLMQTFLDVQPYKPFVARERKS
jgi:hypothetical protein